VSAGMQNWLLIYFAKIHNPSPWLDKKFYRYFGKLGMLSIKSKRFTELDDQVPFIFCWGQNMYCGTPNYWFLSLKLPIVSKD
jgi:hypothetical protein